ncbi:tRNA pseudouridine(38-40) synthase TruA [Clostridium sediminicola]|uniref:tRNA pseudouridine(38-40) synthase TruA n=1 Tax=Clostridium sediminicola TaxID=3114879 RepID=UPI0031F238BD
MKNIKLTLEYDGSRYRGWQKLGDSNNTIQYKLEKTLSDILKQDISIIGSGRTDAGTHALKQVANFNFPKKISLSNLQNELNTQLPSDISVKNIEYVPNSFHSRHSAKKKIYTYQIDNSIYPCVFSKSYAHHIPEKLDIEEIEKATRFLIGKRDFQSFTALKDGKKSTVRELNSIEIKTSNNLIQFVFTGNSFLYKMVRILSGTLIEIGLHTMKKEDLISIMNSKNRSLAGPTAPSKGLFLTDVFY